MEGFDNDLNIIDPDSNHFEANIDFQSHTMDTFLCKQDIDPSSLKIIHHNARSLMTEGRLDEYHSIFQTLKNPFDILVFTETWLTPDKVELCNFDQFQSIHLLRPINEDLDFKLRGGGVSIFIKNNLQFTHRQDLTVMETYIECSFIEMKFNNDKYLIGGIYRVPNTGIDKFIEKLNKIIEPLKSSHKLILLGDYNINLLKDDKHKNDFELSLQSNYLIPTILSATRVEIKIKNNQEVLSATLIDNILINYDMKYQSGIIETSITDHYSIYIIIPEIKKIINESNKVQYRLNNYKCQRKFNFYLNHYEITQVLDNQIAESAYEQFYKIFQDSYNKSFPIKTKTVTLKDLQKPWVTETHLSQINKRDNLKKLFKKKKINKRVFTEFRNKLRNDLRQAKRIYFEEQFENSSNNIKKTWEVINSIIRKKRYIPK